MTSSIGWLSALVLIATLIAQIAQQWRDRTSRGISRWLFVGQLAASLGFTLYSARVGNSVFVVTNSLIAAVAVFGQLTYYRNRRSSHQDKS
ncbi:MAG TPA: hypothetical protein VK629_17205 [Steroidobacteraceae bacterium]|nr:hypothetical protein [Steroidobacteraceae bacterium]